MAPLITFSSDYGLADEFVGVCRLVIARIAPDVPVIDVVHGLDGVRTGSVVLAQSLPESPAAVHLAIVDPGVGTDRRAIAISCGGGSLLVGPDNGLLFPAADRLGGAAAAHELVEERYRSGTSSNTFHGRDIFAPAAAHLSLGVEPSQLGPRLDVGGLVRMPPAFVRVGAEVLEADVVRTDRFGNLQTAATATDLEGSGLRSRVEVNGVPAVVGLKFADARPGELLVYVNSAGRVAIAGNAASASALLQSPDRVTVKGNTQLT